MRRGNSISAAGSVEGEIARSLVAVRISGTITVLAALGLFYAESQTVPGMMEIFENLVKGGTEALPPLTKVVLGFNHLIFPGVSCLSLALLGILWVFTRRLQTGIWLACAATTLPLLAAAAYYLAMYVPAVKVITDFSDP